MIAFAKSLFRFWLLGLVLISGIADAHDLPKYDTLYVFGDSLSDVGNDFIATPPLGIVPAVPPSISPYATYYQGRFSNGPVAVEYLWRLLSHSNDATIVPSVVNPPLASKGAVGFAFGGSGSGLSNLTPGGFPVPGVLGQIGLFKAALAGSYPRKGALYVVWTGSNDYLQKIAGPEEVIGNVAAAIGVLYKLGGRDFLVPNLPDIGLSPLARSQGAGAQLTKLSKVHNALLDKALDGLSAALPGVRIMRLDVFAIGQLLVNKGLVISNPPALEYLKPGSGAVDCLFRDTASCVDVDVKASLPPFLFWDVLHPTTQVHATLGLAMYGATLKRDR